MTTRVPARFGLAAVATGMALLLAGCGTGDVAAAPTAQGRPAAVDDAGGSGAGPAIDACSYFTAAEVAALIGSSPAGTARTTPNGGGSCSWEDTDTYSSLSVDVGDPDTAINGTLPAWDPSLGPERTLPGGMRDVNASVEFVCGGTRYCSVQVVKEIQGDADQKAGIGLVEKIRAKVAG